MMKFNVKGNFLDLPANFNLQLKKKNIYYAFDNIEVERSTSFSIPATENNVAILGWSNDYHRYGERMRQRIAAQLQMGGITKDGYLYVSKYAPNNFDCIFVTGELLGLQAIKELGNWAQFINDSEGVELDSQVRIADLSADYDAARIEYMTDGYIQPSWLLSYYASQAATNADVNVVWDNIAETLAGVRVVIGERKGVPETAAKLTRTYLAEQTSSTPYPTLNGFSIDALVDIFDTQTSEYPIFKYDSNAVQYYGYVTQLVARQDLTLKFDAETSADLFIGYVQQNGTFAFLGDYTLNADGTTTGETLAGKEVEITTGQAFVLISKNDLLLEGAGSAYGGWTIANETLTANVVVKGAEEQPNDAYIRVKDNLPEISIVELLKTIAAITGTILSYEQNKIVFIDNVANGDVVTIDKPIKWGDMSRSFADYAQRNVLQYESDENIFASERIKTIYEIDNVNLSDENELQTLPFSEGGTAIDYVGREVGFIHADFKGYTLLKGIDGTSNMVRVLLPQNESIVGLLTQSTSIQLQARMTELEFKQLQNNSVILFDNMSWVWTDAVWSKNVVTLSLSKVAYQYTPPPPPYIPSEYQQVEYINLQSTAGYGYVDLINEDPSVYNFKFELIIQSNANQIGLWWGGRYEYGSNILLPNNSCVQGGSVVDLGISYESIAEKKVSINGEIGSSKTDSSLSMYDLENNSYLYLVPKWEATCNDVISGSNYGTVNASLYFPEIGRNLFPFGRLFPGAVIKLFSAKIEKDGELLCEWIPCYNKQTLAVGIYDRVRGIFEPNSWGSITATAGPNV